MRKKFLVVIICISMILGLVACTKKEDEHSFNGRIIEVSGNYIIVEPDEDEEIRKSSDKFQINVKDPGFSYSVGDYVKIVYEGMIKESYPAQVEAVKVELLYTTVLKPFRIERYDQYDAIKYYPYYQASDRIIYFAGDIKEFYVMEDDKEVSLKEFVTSSYQTFEDSIKDITSKMEKNDMLKDGGTTIYKSKDLDLTITVCKTLDGNKDVYFNNYKSEFEESMCK